MWLYVEADVLGEVEVVREGGEDREGQAEPRLPLQGARLDVPLPEGGGLGGEQLAAVQRQTQLDLADMALHHELLLLPGVAVPADEPVLHPGVLVLDVGGHGLEGVGQVAGVHRQELAVLEHTVQPGHRHFQDPSLHVLQCDGVKADRLQPESRQGVLELSCVHGVATHEVVEVEDFLFCVEKFWVVD